MKNLVIGVLVLASVSAFGISGSLDGSKYCRSVQAGGIFGQPVGTRSHCVSFQGGRATDNANTFFGNPPKTFTYDVIGSEIMNVDTNKSSGYEVKEDSIVIAETGAVLNIVK